MTTYKILGTLQPERLTQIAAEVERRSKVKRDFLASRERVRLEDVEGAFHVRLDLRDGPELFRLDRHALAQLSQLVKLPIRTVEDLEARGHRDLVAGLVNGVLSREPGKHLFRELDGSVRAVLSDRFRCLDNRDAMAHTLQAVKACKAQVWDLRLTDSSFRVLAAAPHIAGQVRMDRPIDGWRWKADRPDVVNAACVVENGETGGTSLKGSLCLLRGICMNFSIHADCVAERVIHSGKRLEGDGVIYSAETQAAEDRAVWLRIRDLVTTCFTPERFQALLDTLNAATQRVVEKDTTVTAVVDVALTDESISQELREAIYEEMLSSGDRTQYGLAQAITAAANPVSRGRRQLADADLNALEALGGEVLSWSASDWTSINAAARELATSES